MNTQMNAGINARLKSGTEVIFNGKSAFVEHDREDGFINLRPTKAKNHKEDDTFLISKSEIKLPLKFGSSISAKPKKATTSELSDKKALDAFFIEMGKKVPFNCQCCRKPLYALNKAARRAVTCHIIPKGLYPELATDPDNVLFMGVYVFHSSCNDHAYWDASVESRMKMPIYDLALKRYQEKLRHKLSPAKQQLADEYMGLIKKSNNLSKDIAEGKI